MKAFKCIKLPKDLNVSSPFIHLATSVKLVFYVATIPLVMIKVLTCFNNKQKIKNLKQANQDLVKSNQDLSNYNQGLVKDNIDAIRDIKAQHQTQVDSLKNKIKKLKNKIEIQKLIQNTAVEISSSQIEFYQSLKEFLLDGLHLLPDIIYDKIFEEYLSSKVSQDPDLVILKGAIENIARRFFFEIRNCTETGGDPHTNETLLTYETDVINALNKLYQISPKVFTKLRTYIEGIRDFLRVFFDEKKDEQLVDEKGLKFRLELITRILHHTSYSTL